MYINKERDVPVWYDKYSKEKGAGYYDKWKEILLVPFQGDSYDINTTKQIQYYDFDAKKNTFFCEILYSLIYLYYYHDSHRECNLSKLEHEVKNLEGLVKYLKSFKNTIKSNPENWSTSETCIDDSELDSLNIMLTAFKGNKEKLRQYLQFCLNHSPKEFADYFYELRDTHVCIDRQKGFIKQLREWLAKHGCEYKKDTINDCFKKN